MFALGVSGYPNLPQIPGAESFLGEQHHSNQHPGPEAYKGKKCLVLGSNNSAHDICAAFWEHGADVTMVQRTSTHIAPSDSLMELALGGLYSTIALYSEQAVKAGVTPNMVDLIFASIPYKIMARASASDCGCASAPRLAGATSWPERDGQPYSE